MTKCIFIAACALCLLISTKTSAQQAEKISGAWKFHSINQVGMLQGEAGLAWQIQTVNGVQYRSWFIGIGLGLEDYRFRGIPVFADLRKEFGSGKNKFFLYGDAGIHLQSVKYSEKYHYSIYDHFTNGLYLDAGLGYKWRIFGHNALLLSAGYSYKSICEALAYPSFTYYPILLGMQQVNNIQKNQYSLNRLSFKLGWEF